MLQISNLNATKHPKYAASVHNSAAEINERTWEHPRQTVNKPRSAAASINAGFYAKAHFLKEIKRQLHLLCAQLVKNNFPIMS